VQVFREALSALSDVMQTVMDVARDLAGIVTDVFTAIVGEATEAAGIEIPNAMQVWRNAMDIVRVAALALKAGIVHRLRDRARPGARRRRGAAPLRRRGGCRVPPGLGRREVGVEHRHRKD
jgi:hypothetical protein